LSWFTPTGAISPDSGSIQAILTTWPASGFAAALVCAITAPVDNTSAAPTVRLNTRRVYVLLANFMGELQGKCDRRQR